jgi:hypothetical protein
LGWGWGRDWVYCQCMLRRQVGSLCRSVHWRCRSNLREVKGSISSSISSRKWTFMRLWREAKRERVRRKYACKVFEWWHTDSS